MQQFNHRRGQYLQIDDANIYYEIIGKRNAPCILLIHGGGHHMEEFNSITPALADKFTLIAIDCRGHGKSSFGSKKMSYRLLQEDVEVLLEYLKVNVLSIIGFSNGGTIAYRLAAQTNLQIDKLVTISAPWHTKYIQHLFPMYKKLTSDDWRKAEPLIYESYMQLNPEPDFEKLFKEITDMALDVSSAGRPNEMVARIHCPILSIHGEHDPIVCESDQLALKKCQQNVQSVLLSEVSHNILGEKPVAVAACVKEFMSSASRS